MPLNFSFYAFARDRFKQLCFCQFNAALLSAGYDCLRQRMFAAALKTGRKTQQLVFIRSRSRRYGNQFRLALGKRAGLIDNQSVDFPQELNRLGVSEQQLTKVAATVTEHPLIANTPQPPSEQELLELLREAL